MITDRARELAKLASEGENPLEHLPEKSKAQHELMEELREHCHPTLEEFLELVNGRVYKPEVLWTIYWAD